MTTAGDDRDKMHPEDLRNLIVFIVAAIVVWVTFDHFLLKPKVEELRKSQQVQREAQKEALEDMLGPLATLRPRAEVIAESQRITVENEKIYGSVSLTGARIDDISLREYKKTLGGRDDVNLFSPMGSFHPRYASFGWIDPTKKMKMPGKTDIWQVVNNAAPTLIPGKPLTIYWENGEGLRFERDIEVDENFLFKVTQRVINKSGGEVTLYPYALLAQHGLPEDLFGRWIIHEGPIGYLGDELYELSYKKIADKDFKEVVADEGWLGITDRYWFTSLFPENGKDTKFRFLYVSPEDAGHIQQRYQTDVMGTGKKLQPGAYVENVTHVYTGPKKLKTLEDYEKALGWKHIDLSVDFGMYYFLTKPLYYLLHWLGDLAGDFGFAGNFGLGIIMLTFVVRIVVFPLANTSYRSFAKLRKVSPQMYELRKKYEDDKEKLQQALVKLYEKEKVNPMAGCMPILIQIPIFFALFKVLQISIEMRHAPFYGWIDDLSAPDPTSIFNLFGLIPWDPPGFLMIGAWPIIMLFFMILQKKMSPPPQDKMQKAMMDFMPFFITYILAGFASGLVIYWTFSNALSVIQQYIIMKSMGVEPELFKSKEQKEMDKKIAEGPAVHPELEVIEHEVEDALFGDGDDEKADDAQASDKKPKPKKSKKKK